MASSAVGKNYTEEREKNVVMEIARHGTLTLYNREQKKQQPH